MECLSNEKMPNLGAFITLGSRERENEDAKVPGVPKP